MRSPRERTQNMRTRGKRDFDVEGVSKIHSSPPPSPHGLFPRHGRNTHLTGLVRATHLVVVVSPE